MNLKSWLEFIDKASLKSIDLGLDRVNAVWQELAKQLPKLPYTITVAGTNGKGSCVSMLENIFVAANIKVGSFTSPHIISFNERVKINNKNVTDSELVSAFERVEEARQNMVELTYFEYNTLAALIVLAEARCEVMVLEVGLGGRLDAVNIINPDISIITSVAYDHMEYLGEDLQSIAREKAGIMRRGVYTVCAQADIPKIINEIAEQVGAKTLWFTEDFYALDQQETWEFRGINWNLANLPKPKLVQSVSLQNAAAVLQVVEIYNNEMPARAVSKESIALGLLNVRVLGRLQEVKLSEKVEMVFDVAHNEAAMRVLAEHYRSSPPDLIIFSTLQDKDTKKMLMCWQDLDVDFFVFEINNLRAKKLAALKRDFKSLGFNKTQFCEQNIKHSLAKLINSAKTLPTKKYRVLVTGSFLTVSEVSAMLGIAISI